MKSKARSPRITRLSWGRVEVDGRLCFKDAKLFPGGAKEWDWSETGTHHVPGTQAADVKELLEHGARVVVLSKGIQQRLQVCPETLRTLAEHGVTAHVLQTEEALYRVTQEALSNVMRHARAKTVHVSATVTQDQVVLRIADDGRGIDTEFRPGIGLSSMRTRLESGGGHLRVTPNTPSGTLIEARLPRVDR